MRLIKDNVERITKSETTAEKLKALGFKPLGPGAVQEMEKGSVDIEKMTVPELKALAKEKRIEGYSSLSKEELLEVLKDVV